MKKFIAMALIGLFFSGCASIERSEFWKHEYMYENWDHVKYSWEGYKNPTDETLKKSQEQGWWGIPTTKK